MDKQLLFTIIMPNFPRKIKLSDSRRAKYYKIGDDLPLYLFKRLVNSELHYKERRKGKATELFDIEAKEFIIKNARVAGTEKWEIINGQKLYNQGYHPFTRKKIVDSIHEFMLSFLEAGGKSINYYPLEPIKEYPIFIEYIFQTSLQNNQDIDNFALPYYKCFQDCLVKSGIIVNDTCHHIKGFSIEYQGPRLEERFERIQVNIYKV